MNVGKFKISLLEFGRFKLDGGAMFGVVPRVLWEKFHPADEKNRIDMALRCTLIEVDDRKIIIDNGFGQERKDKFKKIYAFDGSDNYLDDVLNKIKLTTSDITDVILTHLHFDHCGGSTINKSTEPRPAFPNATYYIQKKQLEHARSRFERDKASYFPEDFEPLIEMNMVEQVDGSWELIPGIDTIICNGHTPAMQLPRIQDDGKTVVFGADLLPLASQVSLPWIMAYDLYPVTTLEEKKRFLESALNDNWILILEHDPVFPLIRIGKSEKGLTFKPS